ncbi:hypothetical protein [Vibrio phage JSF12]|uniref:Uncharacterized protein n=2 Tax=Jesfedecavirus TaxID=2560156 RepID=A0A2D0YNX9_9CAUD|nr:hypothetical protein HOS35_gp084 [Vibrio phage JSF12]ASV43602.1 hypothetical protein [Vibrio phage JSF12]
MIYFKRSHCTAPRLYYAFYRFHYSIYEVRDKLRKAGMADLEIAKEIRKLMIDLAVFEKNPGAVALNVMRDVLEFNKVEHNLLDYSNEENLKIAFASFYLLYVDEKNVIYQVKLLFKLLDNYK